MGREVLDFAVLVDEGVAGFEGKGLEDMGEPLDGEEGRDIAVAAVEVRWVDAEDGVWGEVGVWVGDEEFYLEVGGKGADGAGVAEDVEMFLVFLEGVLVVGEGFWEGDGFGV